MATMGFIKSSKETATQTPSSILVEETFTHSIAFGQTGCGKTTSFIYPNLQKRLELGHGILLYDYKGKEHLSVKYLAEQIGRLDNVVEVGKPWGENINIIQNMDEDELDKFFDNILKHGDDNKYWQNSAKSLGQSILKVLKAIEVFSNAMCLVEKNFLAANKEIRAKEFSFPTYRTLSSMLKVCKTFEDLENFIKSLESLTRKTQNIIDSSIQKILARKKSNIKLYKNKYKTVLSAHTKLISIMDDTKDALDSFGEKSNENLTQNIMGSLTAPLLSLSQSLYFNENEFDIVKALGEGKIIILNTEALSTAAVESLNNVIMYELSKRTKNSNIHPVSIFIDEVQRVVSKSTDFPIDVFREAKVDLFLATQNSALLKDKLKDEKYNALMGNLTSKYYFLNTNNEDLDSINELVLLEPFEYISSQDDYSNIQTATPIFMDLKEKLDIEYMYQQKLNVLNNYLYQFKSMKLILKHDSRLYQDNKVIAVNINTQKERILESLTKSNIEYLENEVVRLFKKNKLDMEIDEFDEAFDDELASILAS